MRVPRWLWLLGGVVVGGGLLAPFASPLPDGLESVIDREGIQIKSVPQAAPLPDYQTPGVASPRLCAAVAAALGIAAAALLTLALSVVLGRWGPRPENTETPCPVSARRSHSASCGPDRSP